MAGSLAEIDRASYPGLNFQSVQLWRQWLKLYQGDFASYDYNVRVGQGITPPANLSDEDKARWIALTQKRIDVVAHRWDSDWIIEIMERPGLATVGQIIGYNVLARKYLALKPTVRLALICARLGRDMGEIFAEHNVIVFWFPVGKTPRLPANYMPTGFVAPPSA